jgi:hypothetical protein
MIIFVVYFIISNKFFYYLAINPNMPTPNYPPQAIHVQHSFFSASLSTLDVFYTIYTPRLDTPGNPGYSGRVEYKAV